MVGKTLKVGERDYGRKALFAADESDGFAYGALSDDFIATIQNPSRWEISRVYLDDYLHDDDETTTVKTATTDLLNALNAGSLFVSYLGHFIADPLDLLWALERHQGYQIDQ